MLQKGRNRDVNCHGNEQVFIVELCLLTQTSHPFFSNYRKQTDTNSRHYSTISLGGVSFAFWEQCFSSFVEFPS